MNSTNRVAISRLDIALVLLLGLAGLGVWMGTERAVSTMLAAWQPIEKQYQLQNNMPHLQAQLARDQDKLEHIQTKLVEQEIELDRQRTALTALRKSYPHLPENLAAVSDAGMPGDMLREYADTLTHQQVAQRDVSAWETRLADALTAITILSATLQAPQPKAPDDLKQAQLRMAENERSSIEKKLVELRMTLAEKTDLVESMKKSYPGLLAMPDMAGIPPSAVHAYIDSQVGIREAQRQVDQLTGSRLAAIEDVNQCSIALLEAEHKAARYFAWNSAGFGLIKSLLTVLAATIIMVLLLGWIFKLLERDQQVARYNARGVRWAVIVLLTVLFVYQAFQAVSIALAGVALLAMLLWLIAGVARQARASQKTASTTKIS